MALICQQKHRFGSFVGFMPTMKCMHALFEGAALLAVASLTMQHDPLL